MLHMLHLNRVVSDRDVPPAELCMLLCSCPCIMTTRGTACRNIIHMGWSLADGCTSPLTRLRGLSDAPDDGDDDVYADDVESLVERFSLLVVLDEPCMLPLPNWPESEACLVFSCLCRLCRYLYLSLCFLKMLMERFLCLYSPLPILEPVFLWESGCGLRVLLILKSIAWLLVLANWLLSAISEFCNHSDSR